MELRNPLKSKNYLKINLLLSRKGEKVFKSEKYRKTEIRTCYLCKWSMGFNFLLPQVLHICKSICVSYAVNFFFRHNYVELYNLQIQSQNLLYLLYVILFLVDHIEKLPTTCEKDMIRSSSQIHRP